LEQGLWRRLEQALTVHLSTAFDADLTAPLASALATRFERSLTGPDACRFDA